MNDQLNRRKFLQFLSASGLAITSGGVLNLLNSCGHLANPFSFKPLNPSSKDELLLVDGMNYDVLISMGDKLNAKESFGDNNDYLAYKKLSDDELILWSNHEYTNKLFFSGLERTKTNIKKEMSHVGGSLVHIKKVEGKWKYTPNHKYNKRFDANSAIPFAGDIKVKGEKIAYGTMANCAGGKTPWGTILTCEENYDGFWGERAEDGSVDYSPSRYGWEKYYKRPPEHYGWVVEIDPLKGKAQKHVSIGRFAHECATVILTKKGLPVIYSGDDSNDECLYKYIGEQKDKIGKGMLYVANLEQKKWIALDYENNPILKKNFKSQLDILINTRKAAHLVGATKLDRPEDIEIDPISGNVFIALTNNKKRGNFMGQILKISESKDYDSLSFTWEIFLTGGEESTLACPDNLAFDQKGNLWITTDISGWSINKIPYKKFQNNGLFVVPRSGRDAGKAIQIASAPVDAEFTGICFSPDYKELFLSVQHPGETSKSKENPTSHWPNKSAIPKSSVVVISGPSLTQITGA